jgi:hypothetical protein
MSGNADNAEFAFAGESLFDGSFSVLPGMQNQYPAGVRCLSSANKDEHRQADAKDESPRQAQTVQSCGGLHDQLDNQPKIRGRGSTSVRTMVQETHRLCSTPRNGWTTSRSWLSKTDRTVTSNFHSVALRATPSRQNSLLIF